MDFDNYLKLFSLRRYLQNFDKNITVSDLLSLLQREVKEYFEDILENETAFSEYYFLKIFI